MTSRSIREIRRANLLTRFNALLGALLVVMLVVGPPQDALFGLVLIANLTIGVIQELRAKYTLDRLSVLHAARASVVRSGTRQAIPVASLAQSNWRSRVCASCWYRRGMRQMATHSLTTQVPMALLLLSERIRPDAAPTLRYFEAQGVSQPWACGYWRWRLGR